MLNLDKVREACFFAVIKYLNDHEDYSVHVYDCGRVGVLHVWYSGSWRKNWYDLEKLPREAWKAIEEGGQ